MSETAPTLDELRISDVMHPGILTCARETPLRTVASMMARYDVHAVVVFGDLDGADQARLWGIVSDLDLVGSALAGGLDDCTAAATATTPVVTVSGRETLDEAARLMVENATAHLIVIEPDTRQPVGVVSTLDIAAALAGAQLLVGPPRAGGREPVGAA
jgi:CBS domain-containing protein